MPLPQEKIVLTGKGSHSLRGFFALLKSIRGSSYKLILGQNKNLSQNRNENCKTRKHIMLEIAQFSPDY